MRVAGRYLAVMGRWELTNQNLAMASLVLCSSSVNILTQYPPYAEGTKYHVKKWLFIYSVFQIRMAGKCQNSSFSPGQNIYSFKSGRIMEL